EGVEESVAISIAAAGGAVPFSGLTVTIGLIGLIFFRITMLRSVGMGGVLVVMLAVLAAITLLPAVLAIIGTRINAFPVRLPRLWRRNRQGNVGVSLVGTRPGGPVWGTRSGGLLTQP